MDYKEYLQSDDWKAIAQERMKIDGYRCCMCGCRGTMTNRLEIHHLTYRNLYHERPYEDLLTLCHVCHKSVHRMMERKTSPDGRRGWKDERIPDIHVYTFSGTDTGAVQEMARGTNTRIG